MSPRLGRTRAPSRLPGTQAGGWGFARIQPSQPRPSSHPRPQLFRSVTVLRGCPQSLRHTHLCHLRPSRPVTVLCHFHRLIFLGTSTIPDFPCRTPGPLSLEHISETSAHRPPSRPPPQPLLEPLQGSGGAEALRGLGASAPHLSRASSSPPFNVYSSLLCQDSSSWQDSPWEPRVPPSGDPHFPYRSPSPARLVVLSHCTLQGRLGLSSWSWLPAQGLAQNECSVNMLQVRGALESLGSGLRLPVQILTAPFPSWVTLGNLLSFSVLQFPQF